ncbi:hypothetical protein Tco_0548503 [Tanacetum coccineum]
MLTSKWYTLNHNCQKFNAIFKRCKCLGKSAENKLDVMKRARTTYRKENKYKSFAQEDVWAILKLHSKWDASDPVIPVDPVDLTGGEQVPGDGQRNYSLKIEDHVPPAKPVLPKTPNLIPRRAPGECASIVGIKHRHNVVHETFVDISYQSGISAGKKLDIKCGL